MRFTIGMDLGVVLAKGIIFSLLTVIFLQPALVIIFSKQMEKSHKFVNIKLKKPIKEVIKYRSIVVAMLLISIVPVILIQNGLSYNYFDIVKEKPQKGVIYDKVDTLANQIVISVPIDMDSAESLDKHYAYIDELKSIKNSNGTDAVSFMLGLNALVPRAAFDSEYADMIKSQSGQYVNNGYGMYTIGLTNSDIESDEMFETIAEIERVTQEYFPGQTYYLTGMAQASRDFAAITPTDFTRVSVASVLIIFIILLLTFKSFKHSIFLVLIIQFGIWINLSIQRITGAEINFMSYIIISSIQMGATVDYAILITSKYRENRKRVLPSHAAYQATSSSVMSTATSATILVAACLSVYFMATNLIVAEITMLIARGSIISLLLVLFVLPSVLSFFDRPLMGNPWSVPPQDILRKFRKRKADKAKENAPEAYPSDYFVPKIPDK
jgi:Predicted exporters of the RND superfamily